jgi:hypothetical protein
VAFQCQTQFHVPAVVRRNEVRAYQQQDDVSEPQAFVDLASPLVASANAPIVPSRDVAAALERSQMRFQLRSKRFVAVRI